MPNIKTLLARIKRSLFKKPFIKDPKLPGFWFDWALKNENAFLVQIGSNDGKTGDPLYPLLQKNKNWKALFVEPVPSSFAKLKANYPDSQRFTYENVAINEGRRMTFYSVDPAAKNTLPDLPYWFDQLGSFNQAHILKHFDGKLKPFIREQILEGVSLPNLLGRNAVEKISILHIDTEGYDWKILSQLDLEKYEPQFILFEQNHLSQNDKQAAEIFLGEKYVLFSLGIDILAVNKILNARHLEEMKKHLGNQISI